MTTDDIIRQRLLNLHIAHTPHSHPHELVGALLAMQAQEYAMAKWAIGLRLPGSTDAAVEKAFNEGQILRTHLMRPTWHFVAPADIRWLLRLTAPHVHRFNAYMYRKMELDETLFRRCNHIIAKELEGGKFLTRTALNEALSRETIPADGIRLSCIMMCAELEGIICSGPRQGKQFTYALLDERVPDVPKPFYREEALAELATRYFATRGPAILADFTWWSGLSSKDAKAAIGALSAQFVRQTVDGEEYVYIPNDTALETHHQTTFLFPDFEEYGISYKKRDLYFPPDRPTLSPYDHMVTLDGKMAGTWKRIKKGKTEEVEATPFAPLNKKQQTTWDNAVKKYNNFIRP